MKKLQAASRSTPTVDRIGLRETAGTVVDRSTRSGADARGVAEQPFPLLRRLTVDTVALSIGYALAWTTALGVGGALRWWWKGDPMIPGWSWLIVVSWLAGCFYLKLLPGWGLGSVEETRRTALLWLGLFGITTTVLFFFKAGPDTSRFTVAMAFLTSVPLLLLTRIEVKRILIHFRSWGLPAVIYGAGRTGALVSEVLRAEKGLGFTPIGFFDDKRELQEATVEGLPVLGRSEEFTRAAPVAVLAMPGVSSPRIAELLEGPLSIYRKVIIIPDLFEAPSLWVKPRDFLGVLGLEISSNLQSPTARFAKRAADIVLTLGTAPLWMPLCGVLGLLVWLQDRGHPLFVQERIGRQGRRFKMLKFRTMLVRAEEILAERLDRDPALRVEWETNRKLRRDPRVTCLGRLLRRTSLDELPQLFNVLVGDMSLVGPRPLPPYHYLDLAERVRRCREQVRPGITGLWQVSGRSELGNSGLERWDPYYVRNWSIWLDIVILVRTVRAVVQGGGAF